MSDEPVLNTDQKPMRVGDGTPGPGRPKGLANKSTVAAREAIARFVDGNVDRLQDWLDAIAEDPKHGPKVAFDAFMGVVEYHIPKLARTELDANVMAAIVVQGVSGDEAL